MLPRLGFVGCLFVAHLTGCAFSQPTGTKYSRATLASADKALVYFYGSPGERFGYDRTCFLEINGKKVVDLLHSGYFPYETVAGNLSPASDVNRSLRTFIAGGVVELAGETA